MSLELIAMNTAEVEKELSQSLTALQRVHGEIGRAYDGEGGGAPSCLALMEIAIRNLRSALDAAKYARHAMIKHPPIEKGPQ